MRFRNLEELKKIGEILAESDFDRANCSWEPALPGSPAEQAVGALFILETSRPPTEPLKGAGLFRKNRQDWIPCRLTFLGVKGVSIWEEYDAKPPLAGLLEVESCPDPIEEASGSDFEIHLRSAHGLRVDLLVGRLEGALEEG